MIILKAAVATERGMHRKGNMYAPDVHFEGNSYRMYYGAQGADGHDRIHLALSQNGINWWTRRGVVLGNGAANHVNDPSVVKVGKRFFMYYTEAKRGIIDCICLATSQNGLLWNRRGKVLGTDATHSMLVGRPSVILDEGIFKLWYDGRSNLESRSVAYATSKDGLEWQKHGVVLENAGAVDVKKVGSIYTMVFESSEGVYCCTSKDGLAWGLPWLWLPMEEKGFGYVTPMLFMEAGKIKAVYAGLAQSPKWDNNCIIRIGVS
jgi:predicted GH43/DUF377 family glycosyl hydrolase